MFCVTVDIIGAIREKWHKELKEKVQVAHQYKLKLSPDVHNLSRRLHKCELLSDVELDRLSFEMDLILDNIIPLSPNLAELLQAESGPKEEPTPVLMHNSSDFTDTDDGEETVCTDQDTKSICEVCSEYKQLQQHQKPPSSSYTFRTDALPKNVSYSTHQLQY